MTSVKMNFRCRDFLIAIVLFCTISIDSLNHILPSFLGSVLNTWIPMGILGFMFLILLFRSHHISPVFILIFFYFAIFIFITMANNPQATISLIKGIAPTLAMCTLCEYYMRQEQNKFLHILLVVLLSLIIIDVLTELLYPNGLYASAFYDECWFLGYKTARLRAATLPVILVSGILSIQENEKLTLKFWIISALAFFDTIMSQATGGVVAIFIMLVLLFALYATKNVKIRIFVERLMNFRVIFIIVLVFTYVFNIAMNVTFLEPIISGILGKDLTITGRFWIWQTSISLIQKSFIFGSGYITIEEFARLVGFAAATQPHSLLLSVFVYTGLIGFIFYIVLLNFTFTYIDKDINSTSVICGIYIISMLVHGIVSMHLFAQFLYPSMIMLYYLSKKDKKFLITTNSV